LDDLVDDKDEVEVRDEEEVDEEAVGLEILLKQFDCETENSKVLV
jgi:hypothetical protein